MSCTSTTGSLPLPCCTRWRRKGSASAALCVAIARECPPSLQQTCVRSDEASGSKGRRATQQLLCGVISSRCGCSTTTCLLYTSDAADEEDSVDIGGRRIIKKKKKKYVKETRI